jgi:hypothetical protein
MRYLFGIVGALFFFVGLLGAGGSSTAVGQIGSLIGVLTGAVFLVGAGVLAALEHEAQGIGKALALRAQDLKDPS